MQNIFQLYPEFIDTDVRTNRPSNANGSYNVNSVYQFQRHNIAMPPESLKGLRVLDLGCCVGATGAWALHYGAERYVGVELQKSFSQLAQDNLTKHFPKANWDILLQSFSEFFASNTEQFDLVVAFGILYHSIEIETLVRNLSQLNADVILIDTQSTKRVQQLFNRHKVSQDAINELIRIPYIELSSGRMAFETGHKVVIESAHISSAALEMLFNRYQYGPYQKYTKLLKTLFPVEFETRYCMSFKKGVNLSTEYTDFETTYNNPDKQILLDFDNFEDYKWSFNSNVANDFDHHARQHIPDYDRVIDLCIAVCQQLIKDPAEDRILEVGSAVGETIKRLFAKDFHNLVGVESSASMLDKIVHIPIAQWIHSDQFPSEFGPYQAILCNWTLHFIKDKRAYLQAMYNGLTDNGFVIISDKTCNTGLSLDLYHSFKRTQGVSEEEIAAKAASVQDIMFINEPNWYLDTLKEIGFKQVTVINSAPCFTTFLAQKY
jgi:tRNA (cmo5U34)-methyltransferase